MADSSQNDFSGSAQKPTLSWQSPAPAKPVVPVSTPVPVPTTPPQNKIDKPAQITIDQSGSGSSMLTYAIVFVAGLIIGTLLGWAISHGSSTSSPTNAATTSSSSTETSTSTMSDSSTSSAVQLDLQQSAGSKVAVSKVSVGKPTWVVVYDNSNGTPGRALGATLFLPTTAGGETSGTIDLLRPTVSGTTYLIGQLEDDGDYLLSFQKDRSVSDPSGKPILMTLTAK